MSSNPLSRVPGVRSGFAALIVAFVAAAVPPAVVSVGAWAAEHRFVAAEAGSPFPGKWDPTRAPYLREIEDCISFTHPCTEVVVKKSAQIGVSEIGINTLFSIAHSNPCPVLIVLPTTDEVRKYNKLKLQPNIDATPAVAAKILDTKSRDADSSTASVKRFRGGYAVITGANSSVGLQMISARVIIYEEPSGYPADAGGRGDPIEQAKRAGKAWDKRHPKRLFFGTPALDGACRISVAYDATDQRRRYVQCPGCGTWQILRWDEGKARLRWKQEVKPYGAFYVCAHHGCVIEPWDLADMDAVGRWLKTYRDAATDNDGNAVENAANPAPPELIDRETGGIERWIEARGHHSDSRGREPGFAIWQIYSPFTSWDTIVKEWLEAKGKPAKLKVFVQQTIGEAFAETGEAPDHEKLLERARASGFPFRKVPPAALFITVGVDVQGDRLEHAAYAWTDTFESWLIDKGVIEGNPETDAPWRALAGVLMRTYPDAWGKEWPVDALGVDAGYLSNRVYRWVRAHRAEPDAPRQVFALDGRTGWKLPPLGTPRTVDVDFEGRKLPGGVRLWPVGTFDMKSQHYAAIRTTIAGPDAEEGEKAAPPLHLNDHVDGAYCEQLTSEHVVETEDASGVVQKVWQRIKSRRNEALDIAVYARALAHHFASLLNAADWQRLAARRHGRPETMQMDFAGVWSMPRDAARSQESRASVDPSMSADAKPAAAASAPAQPPERRASAGSPAGPAPARSLGGTGRRLS